MDQQHDTTQDADETADDKSLFSKIRDREIPTEFVYEDEDVMVIRDAHPVKPIHLLVIPKKEYRDFIAVDDQVLLTKLFTVAQRMIREQGLEERGYQIIINGGGSQEVDHLHIHVMGPMRGKTKMM